MSFFTKMMEDAKPKAIALTTTTKSVATKIVDNKAVQAAKNIGYKSLVNTVGVAAVVTAPAVEKAMAWIGRAAAPAAKK